jgi:hypothetical protein
MAWVRYITHAGRAPILGRAGDRAGVIALRLSLMGALLFLAGCSSFKREWGRSVVVPPGRLVEGRTRAETIVQKLGPPTQLSALPDGFAFLYEHSRTGEFQFGLSLDPGPMVDAPEALNWFKLVLARNHLELEVVLLTFNEEGVLRAVATNQWSESLGGGGAIQFLFAVMSLSDVPALRRPADAHRWGRTMLRRPPVTLNNDQSLRTGAHGLQQRLAPAYAGQSTLEMNPPKKLKEKKRSMKQ